MAMSWGVFIALLTLVAAAVETRATVSAHTQQINELKSQAAQAATKDDIKRLEDRVIRIESLLLAQQPRTGR